MLVQGKQGREIRVVMLYRPNYNAEKINSVFNITKTTMTQDEDLRCPREAIYEDLDKEIEKW